MDIQVAANPFATFVNKNRYVSLLQVSILSVLVVLNCDSENIAFVLVRNYCPEINIYIYIYPKTAFLFSISKSLRPPVYTSLHIHHRVPTCRHTHIPFLQTLKFMGLNTPVSIYLELIPGTNKYPSADYKHWQYHEVIS